MPAAATIRKAQRAAAAGKSPSTQAGEFVHAEMDQIRRGGHGARSARQAVAIGLSEARRAGVKLPPPGRGQPARTRKKAAQDEKAGAKPHRPSRRRSRASLQALRREGGAAASKTALSRQAKSAARRRGPAARSAAAKKAARTRAGRAGK